MKNIRDFRADRLAMIAAGVPWDMDDNDYFPEEALAELHRRLHQDIGTQNGIEAAQAIGYVKRQMGLPRMERGRGLVFV
jgi:hypothetical protein